MNKRDRPGEAFSRKFPNHLFFNCFYNNFLASTVTSPGRQRTYSGNPQTLTGSSEDGCPVQVA